MTTLFLLVWLFASSAFADKCKDPIVDEVSAFTSADLVSIQNAQAKLSVQGIDSRIQILSSYHRSSKDGPMMKSINEYKNFMLGRCTSWQSTDKGLKNNMVLFIVVPKKQDTSVIPGDGVAGKINKKLIENDMNARFRDGKIADGIVVGLNDVADLISVKPSQVGKPVVINHPTDYSGLWKVMMFGGGFISFVFVVWLISLLFRKREVSRGAQRDAQTERVKCTQATNSFETPVALLKAKINKAQVSVEWKARLEDKLDQTITAYSHALSSFDALNRSSNNPDTPRLSEAEYQKMQTRYAEVVDLFELADEKRSDTERELRRAFAGESIIKSASVVNTATRRYETNSGTKQQGKVVPKKTVQPVAVAHGNHSPGNSSTVVILNDHDHYSPHHHYDDPLWSSKRTQEPDRPVIVDPTENKKSEGDGSSTGWGKTSDGDGSSTSWGKSSQGDGGSTSWNDDKKDDDLSSSWSGGSGTSY